MIDKHAPVEHVACWHPLFWVQGSGLGFRVQFKNTAQDMWNVGTPGLGFRVQGLGFRVQGLGFGIGGCGVGCKNQLAVQLG